MIGLVSASRSMDGSSLDVAAGARGSDGGKGCCLGRFSAGTVCTERLSFCRARREGSCGWSALRRLAGLDGVSRFETGWQLAVVAGEQAVGGAA